MGKKKKKRPTQSSNSQNKRAFNHRPFAKLRLPEQSREEEAPISQPAEKNKFDSPKSAGDDEWLLAQEMSDVAPLSGNKTKVVKQPQVKPMLSEIDETELVMRHLDELVHGQVPFDFADTDEYIEAAVTDLDRRIVRRLRRGEYSIQGYIDLHGLNRDDARLKVAQFISTAHAEGKRCVLIVHGRGMRSKDQIPILKNKLRVWLTRGAIGKKVLAFTSARPFDGGTGAVYVLLRA